MTDSNNKGLSLWPATLTVLAVVVVWVVLGWIVPRYFFPSTDAGTFGDMFGGVNALFSGLAFAGVIYAILLQRQELKLQRDELELTRAELAGQKEQLAAQNTTFKQQAFENTFFQLLRLHNDIVNAIDLQSGERRTVGRDCFKVFYDRLYGRWKRQRPEDSDPTELGRIRNTYTAYYLATEVELGHYYRSLYNIVKFIDRSPVEDKRLYTNLVRAQLSKYELTLLFYNCLSPLGSEKFRPLVEKYSLLKMVPRNDLLSDAHINEYPNTAFSASD